MRAKSPATPIQLAMSGPKMSERTKAMPMLAPRIAIVLPSFSGGVMSVAYANATAAIAPMPCTARAAIII